MYAICSIMTTFLISLLALIFTGWTAVQAQEPAPVLAWPVDCALGTSCWIQQYPDHDPSPGAEDFACGSATYDGHDGTDIRLRTTKDRALVKAAAAGVVKGARDGMPDKLLRTAADRAAVKDRECGNGIVIDHGKGWETQYCHLRQGSVVVKPGTQVAQGQQLGEVGFSGEAAFPHLHLSVRQGAAKIDPFSGAMGTHCKAQDTAIWADTTLTEATVGNILEIGFASGPVELPELENGSTPPVPTGTDPPALVAYAWLINLRQDDHIDVTLSSKRAEIASNSVTLDRNKAQYVLFAGRKRPAAGWSPEAEAHVVVTRQGKKVLEKRRVLNLR
jgi:hypothetical protein